MKKWTYMVLVGILGALLMTGCAQGGSEAADGGQTELADADRSSSDQAADEAGRETEKPQSGGAAQTGQDEKPQTADGKEDEMKILETLLAEKTKGGSDRFGRAAYITDRIYAENGGNTLFSPLSLDMALGMAQVGAKGSTRTQMNAFLGKDNYATYAKEYLKLAYAYNKQEQDTDEEEAFLPENMWGESVYRIANSIWIDERYPLLPAYRDSMEQDFGAEIDNVDFAGKPAETAERINGWCAEKTEQMIPQIVAPAALTPDTRSVLVNTVYFSSAWLESWNKPGMMEPFVNDKGEEQETGYLYQTAYRYFENDKARAFAYPYRSGLTFVGILPKAEGDFALLDLDIGELLAQEKKEVYDEIYVKMPALDYESDCNVLKDILKSLGMTDCFSAEAADFSNMAEIPSGKNFYISDIIQKCKIELDENGTRAAAATAVLMCENAALMEEMKTTEVYLDRPYAYLIWDEENGEIPFMGKVVTVDRE